MNYLKCPKSKSLSHCLTELFSIYQNKHWTIRRRDDHSVEQLSNCILFKIVGFHYTIEASYKKGQIFHVESYNLLLFGRVKIQNACLL